MISKLIKSNPLDVTLLTKTGHSMFASTHKTMFSCFPSIDPEKVTIKILIKFFQQIVFVNSSVYIVVGSPLHKFGFVVGSILVIMYTTSILTSMNAIVIPFYMRYLVVCK